MAMQGYPPLHRHFFIFYMLVFSKLAVRRDVHRSVLDLVQHQVPFLDYHLVVLVRRNKLGYEKWETLRHVSKRPDSRHQFIFRPAGSFRTLFRQKANMSRQHMTGPIIDQYLSPRQKII